MRTDITNISGFQYGTWIPTFQIGNGIIRGQYADQIGNWTRNGHQIFVNGFFRLNFEEEQVEDALRRNTTVQEIRIGTLPFESNNGASIFNLMVSNNTFIQNNRPLEIEVLSIGARSIWGSPRMRVFADERALCIADRMPIATELSIQDLKRSTQGIYIQIRVSGTYTAFPDLSATDPVNTPPPIVTQPTPPTESPELVPKPPQPPPESLPEPAGSIMYTVQAGDTLWLISQQFGTTVDKLMEWNHLTSTVLSIGQVLRIPTEW